MLNAGYTSLEVVRFWEEIISYVPEGKAVMVFIVRQFPPLFEEAEKRHDQSGRHAASSVNLLTDLARKSLRSEHSGG